MENNERVNIRKNKSNNGIALILIISILLSFVCGMMGSYFISKTVSVPQVIKNITTSELVENSISMSVDKVYDSTVVVKTYNNGQLLGMGSGFIYKKGKDLAYIITNHHVINNGDNIKIEFNDSDEEIEATILGSDIYEDIAVLTIADNEKYKTVEIGDNAPLKLGDTVFMIGNPVEIMFKGSVTKGILSGKNRFVSVSVSDNSSVDYYKYVTQIDAPINPGNSGGPLCDVSGKVIGVIEMKIVKDAVENMGFAIPIEDVMKYVNIIEKEGYLPRPYLGISMVDVTDTYRLWQNGINVPKGVDAGIYIASVEENEPAAKAGVKTGDIIVKINDEDITNMAEFRYQLYRNEPGAKIVVEVYRDGKNEKITIDSKKSKKN